jgi:hypothetical protein
MEGGILAHINYKYQMGRTINKGKAVKTVLHSCAHPVFAAIYY